MPIAERAKCPFRMILMKARHEVEISSYDILIMFRDRRGGLLDFPEKVSSE